MTEKDEIWRAWVAAEDPYEEPIIREKRGLKILKWAAIFLFFVAGVLVSNWLLI